MLSQIRHLSVPPVFEDEEKTRLARLLHWILLASFVLNSLNITLLATFAPEALSTVWLNGILFVCIAFSFWLMRVGKVQAGSLVECASLWILLTYYLTFSGGVTSPALGLLNIVIIIGGILLGETGAVLFGLLCVITTFASYWAVSSGWWASAEGLATPERIFATQTTIFVGLAVLMGMSGRSIYQALTRARRSEATLAERNRQLEHQIAARQQVEEAYRVLVEHSAQGLVIVQDSRFVFANPRMCQILGYTIEEFLAIENFVVLIHPDDHNRIFEYLRRRLAGEDAPSHYEVRAIHKDGNIIWFEAFVALISYLGSPAIQAAVIDITERKLAEVALKESEGRYRIITELISDFAYSYRVEADGTFTPEWVTHDSDQHVFGYALEEVTTPFIHYHPDDLERARQDVEATIRGTPTSAEYRFFAKDGSPRWIQASRYPVWDEDHKRVVRFYGVGKDVTERKQAEDALRRSEERFSKVFHSSPMPIAISTLAEGRFIDVNESFLNATEYQRDEIIGHDVVELNMWVDLSERHEVLRLLQEQGGVRQREIEFRTKRGQIRDVLVSYEVIDLNRERYLLALWLDITERKRAEQALRESEERYRITSELISDFAYAYGVETDGTFTPEWVTHGAHERFGGYTIEEIGSSLIIFHPDDQARAHEDVQTTLQGKPTDREYRIVHKDGGIRWLHLSRHPVWDAQQNRVVRFYGVGKDITERKRTEEALRRSEERFSKVFHSSPIPIAISTVREGRIIDVNESCHTALGFQRHEMIGHTTWELQFWVDNAEREQLVRLLHEQGAIRQQEFRFRTKRGEIRHALGSFEIIELNGEPCLLTFWLDITERIQAEQALKQSEERFYKTFHANPLAITLSTVEEGRFVDVNNSCLQLLGYSRQEMIGHTAFELNLWDDSAERASMMQTLREQGAVRQMQGELRTKSGKICPIFLSVEIIEIGGHEHLLGMLQDISEIKHAEEVEREQRLFAEALRDVAAALNSTLDMEAVLDQILTHVGHVVPYDAATIMLIDGNAAQVVRSKGFAERGLEQIVKELRFPVDPTIKSSQVSTEQPLSIIEDTQTHQGWIDIPELRWIRSVVSAPIRAGGEVIGFLDLIYMTPGAFTRHRAERLQAFASQASTAIHNAQLFEQLRRLTQQMVSVQEEERRRISRELHDEAGQALIALKMSLEAIKQIPPQETDVLNMRLMDAIQLTDRTMELIRLLAQNLRPAVLDTLGLHLALQSHCNDFARRTGLHVAYTGTDIPRLTDAITTSLYRFVQEALTNVAKHSKATRVRVDLQYDASIIRLSVEDNGQGLDTQAMPSSHRQGVGLIGMQERLRAVNGWLEINPAPIHGLRLLACIPWEGES